MNTTSSVDVYSNTTPSGIYGDHGTHVAGIIMANHNEGKMAGLAPGVSFINISDTMSGLAEDFVGRMATAFAIAEQCGADVINCSWGLINNFPDMSIVPILLEDAIYSAIENGRSGKGCVVVFAAGNATASQPSLDVRYPANSIDEIIVVGAIQNNYTRASYSCYGSQLDVVAPGSSIYSTVLNHGYSTKSGTSMAAPHVAGVASLILSVNPALSRMQVDRIIKGSAQKIGGYTYVYNSLQPVGSWNTEMGHGLIDAFAAVEQAQSANMPDLYIKDVTSDNGREPNSISSPVNISPDIKVCQSGSTNEVPSMIYGNTYTVKVTIRNPSISPALILRSKIKIYWTVATPTQWHYSWTNAGNYCGISGSGVISFLGSPFLTIPANGSTTISTTWTVPTFQPHSCALPNNLSLSFLAVVDDGQLIVGEGSSDYPVEPFVRINNNVAWHKYSLVDPPEPSSGQNAITAVSPNPSDGGATIEYNLPEGYFSAILHIINSYGQTVCERNVYSDDEQAVIHGLQTGVYSVLLEYDGVLLGRGFIVVK